MSYLLPGSETIRVYSRKDWGARAPRPMTDQPGAPREAFLHHSDGDRAESLRTLNAQKQRLRGIQAFHMDERGWSDVAYHFVLFQPYGNLKYARIFEARDWRKVPAAQLGRNSGTLAVCVVGDFTSDVLKRNTRYAIELLLTTHPAGAQLRTLGGHRDVGATTCPGDGVYRWLPKIAEVVGLSLFR